MGFVEGTREGLPLRFPYRGVGVLSHLLVVLRQTEPNRSAHLADCAEDFMHDVASLLVQIDLGPRKCFEEFLFRSLNVSVPFVSVAGHNRSEEHTSELQSLRH